MMKRILAFLAALIMLIGSAALAEDLSSLTDRELMKLYLDVVDEMRSRTAAEQEEDSGEAGIPLDAESEASMVVASRMIEFFSAWQDKNYTAMIELCASEWKTKQENPKNALFSILQNRTPESIQVETISGSSADSLRLATILVDMKYQVKEDSQMIRMTVAMVREVDGLWYINPESLVSYKLAQGN